MPLNETNQTVPSDISLTEKNHPINTLFYKLIGTDLFPLESLQEGMTILEYDPKEETLKSFVKEKYYDINGEEMVPKNLN